MSSQERDRIFETATLQLRAETDIRCACGAFLRRFFPSDTGHRLLCPRCDADYVEELGYGHGV